jgi:hypothetical protein
LLLSDSLDFALAGWLAAIFTRYRPQPPTLALKCSQLPLPLPRTGARIVISVENWV